MGPKEGDLYEVITVGEFTFAIRYGYYTDLDRESDALYPIYPDFMARPMYTSQGMPLVTAYQDSCPYYTTKNPEGGYSWCADCIHFEEEKKKISVCRCMARRQISEKRK